MSKKANRAQEHQNWWQPSYDTYSNWYFSSLIYDNSYTEDLISVKRMEEAVDIVLGMQNSSGGFASYESVRGPAWLEWINPAEVFGNIMIEYCYPECSTACVLGLTYFREQRPNYRRDEIE